MTSLRSAALLCIGITLFVGCKGGEKKSPQEAKSSAATADMSGMTGMPTSGDSAGAGAGAVPGEIRFTAAQVAHGGVRWESVTVSKAIASATVPGQLLPNEDRTARLGATARGRIVAVEVFPGERVAEGQVLARLQSPDADVAQSDLAKAEAEVTSRQAQATYAKSARDRAERLLAIKAMPRQDYERAVADEELAHAGLTQAEAELRRARNTAEQLGAVGAARGEIAVRSPLAGVVLGRSAVPGTVVEAGSPLVIVTQPTSLWLSISAPEQFASLFRAGQRLRFTVPAYAGDTFVARVEAVGAGLEPDTRTLSVRALVANEPGKLKPEMLASVNVDGARTVSAVLLPDDAIQLIEGKPTVFLAQPDGKGGALFTRREVELGSRSGGNVAVIKGLAAGDLVVKQGAIAVKAELGKGSMPGMEM